MSTHTAQNKITDEEIIDFYRSNHAITIRKEDLLRPNKMFVLSLYTQILEQLDIHNLNQPNILALTNNISEQMEEAYWCCNVCKVLNHIVQTVGLNDFKLSDILEPKRSRTIRVLHALAKYSAHYSIVKAEWFEHAEKFRNIHQMKSELEKRKLDYKHSIEDKSMLLSSLKNKHIAQEKELISLKDSFQNNKSNADAEEKKASEIKSKNITLKEQLCALKLEVSNLKESMDKLSQNLISSPHRIIDSKDQLEKKLSGIKDDNCALREQQNGLQEKKTWLVNWQTDSIEAMKELKELIEFFPKIESICMDLEDVQNKTAHLDDEIKHKQIQKQNIEMSIASLKAKLDKQNDKYNREMNILTQLNQGLQTQLKDKQQQLTNIQNSNQTHLDRLKQLQTECNQLSMHQEELFKRQLQSHRSNLKKILDMATHLQFDWVN